MSEFINGIWFFRSDPGIEDTAKIAGNLGKVLKIPRMPLVQTLTPRTSEGEKKSNYSGNFGLNKFPLHTDLAHWYIPPRYFLLRCIRPSNTVTTSFVVASEVFDQEDEATIRRSLFRPRRRLNGRLSILRLKQRDIYRWDTLFIRAMNETAKNLQSRIEEKLNIVSCHKVSFKNPGDCVLVDNWKILHGRSSVSNSELSRKIERVYIAI